MDDYLGVSFTVDAIGLVILIIYLASGTPALIYLKIFFYITIYSIFQLDDVISARL